MSKNAYRAGRIVREFMLPVSKAEAGALARFGRVCHWIGASIAAILGAIAIIALLDGAIEGFALLAVPAASFLTFGRAARYIFAGE